MSKKRLNHTENRSQESSAMCVSFSIYYFYYFVCVCNNVVKETLILKMFPIQCNKHFCGTLELYLKQLTLQRHSNSSKIITSIVISGETFPELDQINLLTTYWDIQYNTMGHTDRQHGSHQRLFVYFICTTILKKLLNLS